MTKSAALASILLLLANCVQLDPDLVKAGRNDNNIVLQQTEDEEVILNLVRVRYGHRPLFFDVSSISTSFTWSQNAAASGTLLEYGGTELARNNLSVRGDLQYTERPTITYTPLGGKDFVKSVLTPADLDTFIIDVQGDRPRHESLGIDLRSFLGTFFFASHDVEVRANDLEMGRAMTTKDKSGKPLIGL